MRRTLLYILALLSVGLGVGCGPTGEGEPGHGVAAFESSLPGGCLHPHQCGLDEICFRGSCVEESAACEISEEDPSRDLTSLAATLREGALHILDELHAHRLEQVSLLDEVQSFVDQEELTDAQEEKVLEVEQLLAATKILAKTAQKPSSPYSTQRQGLLATANSYDRCIDAAKTKTMLRAEVTEGEHQRGALEKMLSAKLLRCVHRAAEEVLPLGVRVELLDVRTGRRQLAAFDGHPLHLGIHLEEFDELASEWLGNHGGCERQNRAALLGTSLRNAEAAISLTEHSLNTSLAELNVPVEGALLFEKLTEEISFEDFINWMRGAFSTLAEKTVSLRVQVSMYSDEAALGLSFHPQVVSVAQRRLAQAFDTSSFAAELAAARSRQKEGLTDSQSWAALGGHSLDDRFETLPTPQSSFTARQSYRAVYGQGAELPANAFDAILFEAEAVALHLELLQRSLVDPGLGVHKVPSLVIEAELLARAQTTFPFSQVHHVAALAQTISKLRSRFTGVSHGLGDPALPFQEIDTSWPVPETGHQDLPMAYCFAAGTPVSLEGGEQKRIEELRPGDKVLSYDFSHKQLRALPVVQTFQTQEQRLWRVDLADEEEALWVTAEHPFFVLEKGWVSTKNLRSGDSLRNTAGQSVVVRRVSSTDRIETVFNVEVAEQHNYFVGKLGVLTHNMCAQRMSTEGTAVTPGESRTQAYEKNRFERRDLNGLFKTGVLRGQFMGEFVRPSTSIDPNTVPENATSPQEFVARVLTTLTTEVRTLLAPHLHLVGKSSALKNSFQAGMARKWNSHEVAKSLGQLKNPAFEKLLQEALDVLEEGARQLEKSSISQKSPKFGFLLRRTYSTIRKRGENDLGFFYFTLLALDVNKNLAEQMVAKKNAFRSLEPYVDGEPLVVVKYQDLHVEYLIDFFAQRLVTTFPSWMNSADWAIPIAVHRKLNSTLQHSHDSLQMGLAKEEQALFDLARHWQSKWDETIFSERFVHRSEPTDLNQLLKSKKKVKLYLTPVGKPLVAQATSRDLHKFMSSLIFSESSVRRARIQKQLLGSTKNALVFRHHVEKLLEILSPGLSAHLSKIFEEKTSYQLKIDAKGIHDKLSLARTAYIARMKGEVSSEKDEDAK